MVDCSKVENCLMVTILIALNQVYLAPLSPYPLTSLSPDPPNLLIVNLPPPASGSASPAHGARPLDFAQIKLDLVLLS